MLAKYRLAPSRRRGQNFLVDRNVAAKIQRAVRAGPDDVVVEIGPGFGAITFGLAEAARHVVAVEIDSGIARAFRAEYGEPDGITLVNADILAFDLAGVSSRFGGVGLLVVGNLPYNVTSPVVRDLIANRKVVRRAVLMVQEEVGGRLVAGAGSRDYSALSVVVQSNAVVRSLLMVRRTCFYPRPKVDARVVELDFSAAQSDGQRRGPMDPEVFFAVVHAAFEQRRKMLRQSLRLLMRQRGVAAEALAEASGIELTRRGETLTVEEFAALALALESAGSRS